MPHLSNYFKFFKYCLGDTKSNSSSTDPVMLSCLCPVGMLSLLWKWGRMFHTAIPKKVSFDTGTKKN